MPLVPGYNFVRSAATNDFIEAFSREYDDPLLETLSVVRFLRLLQHRQQPPHRCLMVQGFEQLWLVCEDDEALCMKVKQLLTTRGNWVKGNLSYVYFTFPSEVEFVAGHTVQLRLPTGEHVDLDRIFGQPTLLDRDHYHRPFALS